MVGIPKRPDLQFDIFDALGLPPTDAITPDTIQKAWRRINLHLHPDKLVQNRPFTPSFPSLLQAQLAKDYLLVEDLRRPNSESAASRVRIALKYGRDSFRSTWNPAAAAGTPAVLKPIPGFGDKDLGPVADRRFTGFREQRPAPARGPRPAWDSGPFARGFPESHERRWNWAAPPPNPNPFPSQPRPPPASRPSPFNSQRSSQQQTPPHSFSTHPQPSTPFMSSQQPTSPRTQPSPPSPQPADGDASTDFYPLAEQGRMKRQLMQEATDLKTEYNSLMQENSELIPQHWEQARVRKYGERMRQYTERHRQHTERLRQHTERQRLHADWVRQQREQAPSPGAGLDSDKEGARRAGSFGTRAKDSSLQSPPRPRRFQQEQPPRSQPQPQPSSPPSPSPFTPTRSPDPTPTFYLLRQHASLNAIIVGCLAVATHLYAVEARVLPDEGAGEEGLCLIRLDCDWHGRPLPELEGSRAVAFSEVGWLGEFANIAKGSYTMSGESGVWKVVVRERRLKLGERREGLGSGYGGFNDG